MNHTERLDELIREFDRMQSRSTIRVWIAQFVRLLVRP